MPPKRPRPSPCSVVCLGLLLAACGGPRGETLAPPEPPVVRTVVPEGTRPAFPEPHLRYPLGTRLERVGAGGKAPLAGDLAAAGGAEPALDGRSVLFTGRAHEDAPYSVWRCSIDGADVNRLVTHNGDCGRAAELPDGRLVYAGAVADREPVPGMRSAWALFVAAPGGTGERITFGAGCDVDPALLPDGRIVYASWQPGDGGTYLYTVHPDGSGATRLPGPHGGAPFAVLPRPRDDGTLTYSRVSAEQEARYEVDLRAPGSPDATSGPSPLPPFESVVVAPRRVPQGYLSRFDANLTHGTLLAIDARPAAGTRAGTHARLRAFGDEGSVGVVPLAADGSFFVRVPADTPFLLEVLDEGGEVVGGQATPFWVRPGEVRACVGCHEDPETAPPNRRPLAARREPVSIFDVEDAR